MADTSWALHEELQAAIGQVEPDAATRMQLAPPLRARLDRYERHLGGSSEGVRRARPVAWDGRDIVWEGIDLHSGRRVLVRGGERLAEVDLSLADTLPDELDPVEVARVVIGVLASARRAHLARRCLGAVSPDLVTWDGRWQGTVTGLAGRPDDDLRAIGALAFSLDPEDRCGLGAALAGAPVDVERAVALALATSLAGLRHQVARRERGRRRADGRTRLRWWLHRLQATLRPPPGGGRVGPRHVLHSDGVRVWAGDALIYDGRMDAVVVRALLRAWATGGADDAVVPLLRWLRGMTRLRVDARLLDR